jgi:hypothetical protein
MTWQVLPTMARLFQRFRERPYADLSCRSCHGEDAERVQYKMPNGLPLLDPRHLPDAYANDPKEARMAKFMTEEVTPQMAQILGVPPYDKLTNQGFSCFNCHPSK